MGCKYSGGLRGGSGVQAIGGSSEPPLEPNYLIFMEKLEKNWVKENELPLVNMNSLYRNPGSAPEEGFQK